MKLLTLIILILIMLSISTGVGFLIYEFGIKEKDTKK